MTQMNAPKAKPRNNIYTGLTFVATVILLFGVGFMVYTNTNMHDAPWYDVASWFKIVK